MNTTQSDLARKIAIVAAIVAAIMILFPPKAVTSPTLAGASVSESVGYKFILSDPTDGASASGLVTGGIRWGMLLLQLVVVGGAAYAAIKFTANKQASAA